MSISRELIMNEKLKLDYSDDSHPSELSLTEGTSNSFTSSSSENYPNDHRTIFLCGYVQGRWHNESLNNITNDLTSDFFVCTNKTKDNFSFTLARDMLRNSKTFIFLLNEYTLNDLGCLLCLQYAYEIHLPIIVLRPLKTQLIILNKNYIDFNKEDNDEEDIKNRINNLKLDHQLDNKIISKILFDGYEKSIPYDKLQHKRSMNKLKKQLKISIPITARRMSTRKVGVINVPHQIALVRNFKKDKNFLNVNNISGKMDRQQKTDIQKGDFLIPIKRNPSKCKITEKAKKRKSNIKGFSSMINLSSNNNDNKNENENKKFNLNSYKSLEKNISTSNISTARRSSDVLFSDRDTFKNTRYLVFNGKDSSKKPYLINFPNDLYTEDGEVIESEIYNELKANSNIYGNDDSDFDADRDFDEKEDKIRSEIVLKVKGTLNDDDLYSYEDDLEF
uniref:Enhancer of polycomb-like protein n=1 Tax=Strongyloides stercoralis TaxID=6248 RepID=A0A0K0E351_STRER